MVDKYISRYFVSNLSKILVCIAIVCWGTLIISGLAPDIEMLISHGRIVHVLRPKVLLLASVLLIFILHPLKIPGRIFVPWAAFCVYLLCESCCLWKLGLPAGDIVYGVKTSYSNLLIFPFFIFLSGTITEEKLLKMFIVAFVILGSIALLQLGFNAPILPFESCDGDFKIYSWGFFGQIRAYSLFSSVRDFSYFVNISLFLILSKMVNNGARYFKGAFRGAVNIALISLALLIIYFSYFRTGYVLFLFSAISFFVYMVPSLRKFFKFLPQVYLFAGCLLVLFLSYGIKQRAIDQHFKNISSGNTYFGENYWGNCNSFKFFNFANIHGKTGAESESRLGFASKLNGNGIANTTSFAMRLAEWQECWRLGTGNLTSFLFGTGYIQGARGHNLSFPIDNEYIEVFLQIGFLGLILFLWYLFSIWQYFYESYLGQESIFSLAILSVFLGSLVAGFFGSMASTSILYFGGLFLITAKTNSDQATRVPIDSFS